LKVLMGAEAVDVLQADIYWAGGITEMLKVAALASPYDMILVPHGHSTPASAHFIASQSPAVCPLLEYLITWNGIHQFFLKTPLTLMNGVVAVPDAVGLGLGFVAAAVGTR